VADTTQNGAAIRTFRELRGLSRDDFVKKLLTDPDDDDTGPGYTHVANIENEHRDAKPALLHRIALVLDVPVAAICRKPIYTANESAA
jgi:transcriptional regulator with XRE-family HTH domain